MALSSLVCRWIQVNPVAMDAKITQYLVATSFLKMGQ